MGYLRMLLVAYAMFAAIWPATLRAALNYESIGSTYNENFNSLMSAGNVIPWENDFTLPNWYMFRVQLGTGTPPPVAITDYHAGDGTSGSEHFYSFGPSLGNTSDRAVGAIGGGNLTNFGGAGTVGLGGVIGWIAIGITNNTGSELTQFTARFAGEQWHEGGEGPEIVQTMRFEHGFGLSFDTVTSWNEPGGDFNWDAPVATGVQSKVNGNAEGRVDDLGGTVANLAWPHGSTLWLRWVERNDIGADHGLGIDDFSFSATSAAVPEPGAVLLGGLVCAFAVVVIGIRRFSTWVRKPPAIDTGT